MSYKDIGAGEYTAKPVKGFARFISSSKGTAGLEIPFEFKIPATGNMERLNWVGWLSENAIEKTMETLVDVLGFNGQDACAEDGLLLDPQALAWDKEIKLVIEVEKFEEKEYPKIKWVNKIGGSAFEGKKLDLEKIGFRAAFLAAKQGTKTPEVAQEQIPF